VINVIQDSFKMISYSNTIVKNIIVLVAYVQYLKMLILKLFWIDSMTKKMKKYLLKCIVVMNIRIMIFLIIFNITAWNVEEITIRFRIISLTMGLNFVIFVLRHASLNIDNA